MLEPSFASKARAFVAIDSLEQDLRQCIHQYLLDHLDPEDVFGAQLEDLKERRDADVEAQTGALTDYLYLRQAYDTLLRHKQLLPRDLGDLLTVNVGSMDGFVAVRNRVMHGRPLKIDDLETAYAFVSRFRSRYFPATDTVLSALEEDPTWQPATVSRHTAVDSVLHNLPEADFDETGLVGRADDVRQLVDLLVRGRDRMITLTGEGGIGKTALALDACYSLVDAQDPPFEAILWVSLKNERLTADGVRTISNAIRDVSGATEELGRSLDSSFGGSVDELADYLSGLHALIVIDNLESAQGHEVVALYDALPESVTFLFTSRVGIGQIERRIPITGLSDRDAILLLRKFASRRGQTGLASLREDVALNVVTRLRNSPLAVRWYVLSVEAGKTPTDALRNQVDLLRFCVDNVYEALTSDAKLMLSILRTLDRPISFDELAVVAALDIDTLRRSSQTLAQGSLVVRTPANELGAPDLLELSATARAYLPRVDVESSVMTSVLDREAAFVRDREEARLAAAQRVLDPNVVMARSLEDEPTAHLLRLALRLSRNGDRESAESHISRARMLNPGYYEIDRVDAFLASTRGNIPAAVARYRDALSQCVDEQERARVSSFLAGHLARVGHDLEAAIPLAQYAHSVLANADTAQSLGNFFVWDKQYGAGQELLEQALDLTQSHKMRRIITTAIVESWRRWAEEELTNKMPPSAFEKAMSGVHTGKPLLLEGTHDYRLVEAVARSLLVAVRAMRNLNPPTDPQLSRLRVEVRFVSRDGRFRQVDSWERLTRSLGQLPDGFLDRHSDPLDPRPKAPVDVRVSEPTEDAAAATGRLRGVVVNQRESYAFISHPDFPANVFFHFGSLSVPGDKDRVLVGAVLEFTHARDDDGRDRAEQVIVI
ncbi:NB-ARC domain-containing protein [Microbacterium flavum]|uniref:NB-ARC domain-containing protein n=1 Tax=Microbacterium flavum TaxID=415216 RepID=A0ABS5XX54_9MICO|nr:NB-ARC domain-containing protein [Microbacterium flavum]MBT8798744.1 hypothetical protein [Microbacterium flavum]